MTCTCVYIYTYIYIYININSCSCRMIYPCTTIFEYDFKCEYIDSDIGRCA